MFDPLAKPLPTRKRFAKLFLERTVFLAVPTQHCQKRVYLFRVGRGRRDLALPGSEG